MAEDRLSGRRVLVVEDEYVLAEDLREELVARGAVVIGPAASLEHALALVSSSPPDIAILDLNLRGEHAYLIADTLMARSIPFVFTTGYDTATLPGRFHEVRRCEKPIRASAVLELVASTLEASPPSVG